MSEAPAVQLKVIPVSLPWRQKIGTCANPESQIYNPFLRQRLLAWKKVVRRFPAAGSASTWCWKTVAAGAGRHAALSEKP